MPDAKRIVVFYEGDDDKAVLEGLRLSNLLPEPCEVAQRAKDEHPGRDGLVRQLLPVVRPVNGLGGRAIVMLDLDDLSADQLTDWLRTQVAAGTRGVSPPLELTERKSNSRRVALLSVSSGDLSGQVAIVPVGLNEDPELRGAYGVDRFAVDDHILRLVRDHRVYTAISELEAVAHDLAMRKTTEITELFRKNDIAIHQSKRILHILRAIAGVRPSSATFVSRVMEEAAHVLNAQELREMLEPLVGDLEEAVRLLAIE